MGETVAGEAGAAVRVRKRKAVAGRLNKTRQEKFLAELAVTCNVAASARAVRAQPATIYRQRRSDAGFAAKWEKALLEGYAALELVLLERALHGEGEVAEGGFKFDPKLAMALLAAHQKSVTTARAALPAAGTGGERAGDNPVRRLLAKLDAMEGRLRDG